MKEVFMNFLNRITKVFFAGALAATSFTAVIAEGTDIEAQKAAFKSTLASKGNAEIGSYKVEKIKDGVYHMDENTTTVPGGATIPDYIDRETGETVSGVLNNPSDMYFVVTGKEVVMIDGGDVLRSQEKYDSAKFIIEAMTDGKPLSFILTHGHSDHVRMLTTPGVLDNVNVKAVYVGKDDYVDGKVVGSTTGTPLPLLVDLNKVVLVEDGNSFTIDGLKYEVIGIPAHTPGSLAVVQRDKEVIFTGDSIGSGFVWAFWMYGNNPLGALQDGIKRLQTVVTSMANPRILAGHRWQQFTNMFGDSNPNEMSIQYLNDMSAVISGLADGTTLRSPYTLRGNDADIELSAIGSKAKVDTQQEPIDAYLKGLITMDEAYVYSGSSKLSTESVNAVAAPTFVIFPDGQMSDEDAQKLLDEAGYTEILDRSASKAYVMRPVDGKKFGEKDVERYLGVLASKVGVCENFKLIGIGNGATFINKYLSKYMNFVSGLALIGGEAGETPQASVPTYIAAADAAAYIAANKAEATGEGTYANPNSRFEIVVTADAPKTNAEGLADAWDKVLKLYGRIGNYIEEEKAVGTWYTRPLISGDEEVDTTRKYQYFDSLEAVEGYTRYVNKEDLNDDGTLSLWYEYVPDSVVDAARGSVPVVFLMHGNTNDPRTQIDTAAWANIAVRDGVILVAPEWQGHVYQGYAYEAMSAKRGEDTDETYVISVLEKVLEKYPQADASRVYMSGLSAGSMQTTTYGLTNPKYFAAGGGHSGPFSGNLDAAQKYAESYDFPIIYFTGDKDEYLMSSFDSGSLTGGAINCLNSFMVLNDMDALTQDDYVEANAEIYGVPWDRVYTIEPTEENIPEIIGGVLTNDKGVEISFNRIKGWGHWNYAPDTEYMWDFMRNYSRDPATGELSFIRQGVTVSANTDYPESDAEYQATFTYKASSNKVESVSLVGNWTFYTEDQVDVLIGGTDIDYTLPYAYKKGMFNTGYAVGVSGAGYAPIEMENIGNGFFSVTLPLPGNEYFYGFAENGDLGAIKKDPTNMPIANDGSDSGWSLIWVGDKDHTLEGQEYIYARDDEKVGTVSFETYTAADGTEQPYGIYLPYGYDESHAYPVLYLSHGGGGNEVEWMYIGSAKNIFDNLIAEGSVEPTIVVTMDNTYFGWDMDKISDNMRNYLIPAIEEKYSVKKEKNGRAFAGLSQGGYTTTSELVKSPDLYKYFGIFSANYRAKDLILEQATEEELLALKDNIYYQSCGWVDNGNGAQDRRGTVAYITETLSKYSDNYYFDWKKGAHDWAVWRAQLTTFAKEYLWNCYTGFQLADGTPFFHLSENEPLYWYEDGIRQGVYGDLKNIKDTQYNHVERGREIFDPNTDAWYWLDADAEGAVARNKEVWMPYIFQDEEAGSTDGKWVRYDRYGEMIKGWYANDNGVYYYDLKTGAMLKGTHEINGKTYTFDAVTGIRQ